MFNKFFPLVRLFVCIAFVLQSLGCGVILYPERKGQKSGKIDAGVAVLDGIGLLFFLIPGVIAFAVDFATGTIYLPGTSRVSIDGKTLREVKFDPKHSTMEDVEEMIEKETGYDVKLYQHGMSVVRLHSLDEMRECFARNSSAKVALTNLNNF